MRLRHFSNKPLTLAQLRSTPADKQANAAKPMGIWLSDESDYGWKKWCKGEDFFLENLVCEHIVKLKRGANILHLDSTEKILRFTQKHKHLFEHQFANDRGYVHEIVWEEVAKKYDGIIITPYDWSLRLAPHTMWYYGWDCASGCIWNADAIKSIELAKRQLRLPKDYVYEKDRPDPFVVMAESVLKMPEGIISKHLKEEAKKLLKERQEKT